jgi:hypothetical protein
MVDNLSKIAFSLVSWSKMSYDEIIKLDFKELSKLIELAQNSVNELAK